MGIPSAINKYNANRLFKDGKTKLVIPNLEIAITSAVTNLVSSYVTEPLTSSRNFFAGKPSVSPTDIPIYVASILDIFIVGLGVTKIETAQDYVMPFSKGIGSTGEVIHLLGAKNEMIKLEFTSDQYPGRLGYLIRNIIQATLEMAEVVYLIDDLFLATPCLIKSFKLRKEGSYRGAVMGELEMVSLATGGSSFIDNILGINKSRKSLSTKLKKSAQSLRSNLTTKQKAVIGVGAFAIAFPLIRGVLEN